MGNWLKGHHTGLYGEANTVVCVRWGRARESWERPNDTITCTSLGSSCTHSSMELGIMDA